MNNQFTREEYQQFNIFCVRLFQMDLETIKLLVASGHKLKARNSAYYKKRVVKKKATPMFILPEPPQIDYTEFEHRFPKVYSTGMSSSESLSDKSK